MDFRTQQLNRAESWLSVDSVFALTILMDERVLKSNEPQNIIAEP